MSVQFRKMTLEDIEAVYAIEVSSFTTPWTKDAFYKELVENTLAAYFIVEEDDHVVAYGGMWQIMDELHITNIAVEVEARGKGYSKVLMDGMIDYGKKYAFKHMTLEVRQNNKVAIALYEKYGFESVGIRPKYYMDTNEDALVMWKEL